MFRHSRTQKSSPETECRKAWTTAIVAKSSVAERPRRLASGWCKIAVGAREMLRRSSSGQRRARHLQPKQYHESVSEWKTAGRRKIDARLTRHGARQQRPSRKQSWQVHARVSHASGQESLLIGEPTRGVARRRLALRRQPKAQAVGGPICVGASPLRIRFPSVPPRFWHA